MPRRELDPEGLRTVLLGCAVLLVLSGVGLAVVVRGWAIVAAVFLVVFAAGCVRVARDDGRGVWCEACVARNDEDASACARCGAALV